MRTLGLSAFSVLLAVSASAATITPDVVYGHKDGMALVYDVFQPEDANGAAVLFMVSGGWFSRWQPPERRQRAFEHLLDAGFTVFAVHHGSAWTRCRGRGAAHKRPASTSRTRPSIWRGS